MKIVFVVVCKSNKCTFFRFTEETNNNNNLNYYNIKREDFNLDVEKYTFMLYFNVLITLVVINP